MIHNDPVYRNLRSGGQTSRENNLREATGRLNGYNVDHRSAAVGLRVANGQRVDNQIPTRDVPVIHRNISKTIAFAGALSAAALGVFCFTPLASMIGRTIGAYGCAGLALPLYFTSDSFGLSPVSLESVAMVGDKIGFYGSVAASLASIPPVASLTYEAIFDALNRIR